MKQLEFNINLSIIHVTWSKVTHILLFVTILI